MLATAIVPVKRFRAAKSRLAAGIAGDFRPELARAMLADVLAALKVASALERIVVVTGEPTAREAAGSAGADWLDDPDDAGHSEAAVRGVRHAIGLGADCVALLPGDCPLLAAAELDDALASMEPGVAGVVPDRHGSGTNGLLLAPPDAISPSFGPESRERHLVLARSAGVEGRVVEVPSLALDLDTTGDLRELARLLRRNPERAPATAVALSSIAALDEGVDAR